MDERIVQFRVGVMVLATLIITAILVLLFGNMPKFVQGTYTIHITFPDAPGVTPNTPVRRSGLLIGRVTHVEINNDESVRVTAEINSDVKLRKHHVCQLVTTLLGDSSLEFVRSDRLPPNERPGQSASSPGQLEGPPGDPGDEAPPGEAPAHPDDDLIGPGAELEGVVASDPLRVFTNLEDDAERMLSSMTTAGQDVSETAKRLNGLVERNDAQFGRILEQTEATLKSVQKAADSTQSVLGDPELTRGFKETMTEFPAMFREARDAFQHIDQTLQLADTNLRNLEKFTRPLSEKGDKMFARMDRTVGKLDLVLDQLVDFSAALNSDEGSLGRFLHDPSLYDNMNSAAQSVDRLGRDLRPILDDVRIFTDKIARDPGRLGVRGVFQQNNGLK